jgi:hypothetical protein
MQVARDYVARATGTSLSAERWYATLLELWFRRFSSKGDPDLSGFEHVVVGEQEGAKVQGYHFWYKYWLDDGLAREPHIDRARFPGLADDRIVYLKSEAARGQDAFPESVTISFRWNAPDYDARAIRPLTKPVGGFFVGCSVEGLLALGTVRAHLGARAPKEAVINGARYDLKLYRSPDNKNVRTFYPVFLGAAGARPSPAPQPPAAPPPTTVPPATRGALRILAALVNPMGDDEGGEKVTLINVGVPELRLDGWKLLDRQDHALPLDGQALAPGEARSIVLPRGAVQLSNRGGELRLVEPAGRTVHAVTWSKEQASRQGETIVF